MPEDTFSPKINNNCQTFKMNINHIAGYNFFTNKGELSARLQLIRAERCVFCVRFKKWSPKGLPEAKKERNERSEIIYCVSGNLFHFC